MSLDWIACQAQFSLKNLEASGQSDKGAVLDRKDFGYYKLGWELQPTELFCEMPIQRWLYSLGLLTLAQSSSTLVTQTTPRPTMGTKKLDAERGLFTPSDACFGFACPALGGIRFLNGGGVADG